MRLYPDIPVEKYQGGKPTWWKVSDRVSCLDRYDGARYLIPEGFVTNFATVPAFLYPWIPPHGPSAIPSVKHDYRYVHLVNREKLGDHRARLIADMQYRYDLKQAGVKPVVAQLMFLGVRVGGWWWWNKHAKRAQLRKRLRVASR